MDDVPTRVERATFTPVRLREGYDMAEVDDFLDDVVEAWWAGRPLGPLVDQARFSPVRVREGYDHGEVDAFLDYLRSAPPCPTPSAGPSAGSSAAPPTSGPATFGAAPVGTVPGVIQEQRGLFARLFGRR